MRPMSIALRSSLLALLLAAAALAGCRGAYVGTGGDDDDEPPPPPPTDPTTAREMFDAWIAPSLELACAGCHQGTLPTPTGDTSPNFVGASRSLYYASILAYAPAATPTQPGAMITFANNSILYTKGEHAGPAIAVVDDLRYRWWLDREVVERNITPPPPPPPVPTNEPQTATEAMARWQECMSLADWLDTVGLDNNHNIAKQGTNNEANTNCQACHGTPTDATPTGAYSVTGGFVATADPSVSFEVMKDPRSYSFILKYMMTIQDQTGYLDSMPFHRVEDKADEARLDNHPDYTLTTTRRDALREFIRLTDLRFHDYTDDCSNVP